MVIKVCKRCGQTVEIPASQGSRGAPRFEGWPRDAGGKLKKLCLHCVEEVRPEIERIRENTGLEGCGLKRCSACGEVKARDLFYRGRVGICKSCRNARSRERSREERQTERERAADRKGFVYRRREQIEAEAAFRRMATEVGKAHRAWFAHVRVDRAISDPRLRDALKTREFYRLNRDAEVTRSRDKKRAYRASFRDAGITEGYLARLRNEASSCAYCGEDLAEQDVNVDHIVPLSAGGTSAPENLAVVCGPCNRTKAAKPFAVWARERGVALTAPAGRPHALGYTPAASPT